MSLTPPHAHEYGRASSIVVENGLYKKTSNLAVDWDAAKLGCLQLETYASQLDEEPINNVPLRDTSIVPDGNLFRVQHAVDAVNGPNVVRLPEDERARATAQIVGSVSAMASFAGDPDRLRVPVDSPVYNWNIDDKTGNPVLIDIYPPMLRGSEDIPGTHHSDQSWGQWFGTKSGVMTKAMYTGFLGPRRSSAQRLSRILRRVDDWCYDAVPSDAHPDVKRAVRRQIEARFVPYLAATAAHRVRNR